MRTKVFISIILCLALVNCGKQNSNKQDENAAAPAGNASAAGGASQTTVEQAKDILSKYPTGAKILEELNGQNPYNEPISIEIVQRAVIHAHSGHDGGIKQGSDGKYKILVTAGLTPSDMAQVMAHQLQLIKTEIDEDAYLKANPDVFAKLGVVAGAVKTQTVSKVNKGDADIFFKLLMYSEVRAYEVNLILEQEGLPFPNSDVKQEGVGPYVVKNYLAKNGYTLTDDVDSLVTKINTYQSLVEFQKSL